MIEKRCNIWEPHINGEWVGITTNGFVKANGECVMGRGVAYQAKQRMPGLPKLLGYHIKHFGNVVFVFPQYRVVSFPVKHRWHEKADLELIRTSATQLALRLDSDGIERIYLPRPGCGNGQLSWEQVRPIMEQLDDRVIVVTL